MENHRPNPRPTRRHSPLLALAICASLLITGCATRDPMRGKVVVITGASSGFGKGVALQLSAQGANVVLAARRTQLLQQLARDCEKRGGHALAVTTDVANSKDVAALAQAAVKQFGHIDVWINDAGVGVIGRFWEVPVEDYSRLIDINLKGVVYGSHAALRQFSAQGRGTLVNIGSIDSEVPLA